MLDGLLENAQQNWQFCKETVISPVLDNAPAELKPVLTRILAFDHANTLDHCVWYVGSSARQQAMASLVAYPDLNEETHFLPKMTLTAQKL
ncbi:MAG: hypothetical protein HWD59_09995 [Coxiellaceae bacterium]|nr:MAG: hypothetical protein HWD59_09995 [Coxiellaceae bacterium]